MYQPPAYAVSGGPSTSAKKSQMSSSRHTTSGMCGGGDTARSRSSLSSFFLHVSRAMRGEGGGVAAGRYARLRRDGNERREKGRDGSSACERVAALHAAPERRGVE